MKTNLIALTLFLFGGAIGFLGILLAVYKIILMAQGGM